MFHFLPFVSFFSSFLSASCWVDDVARADHLGVFCLCLLNIYTKYMKSLIRENEKEDVAVGEGVGGGREIGLL